MLALVEPNNGPVEGWATPGVNACEVVAVTAGEVPFPKLNPGVLETGATPGVPKVDPNPGAVVAGAPKLVAGLGAVEAVPPKLKEGEGPVVR